MKWAKDSCRCSLCKRRIADVYDSPMLKPRIWGRISSEHFNARGEWVAQIICLDCMEKALGRKIRESDLCVWKGCVPRHVHWNTKFVKEHFPKHKYPLDDKFLAEAAIPPNAQPQGD